MKVCFVGAGSIGTRHIINISSIMKSQQQAIEIHLLRNTNRLLNKEIENKVSKICQDVSQLDSFYDAIFITNPTYLHYHTLKELQQHSDCFFIEKPIFDKTEYNLSEISAEKKYYVASPLRYTKVLQNAKQLLKKEKVISARAICSSYLPEWRKGVDYRNVYSAHENQGGGVRIDLIHEWDYLVDFWGYPEEVVCFSGKYSELEIDSEDVAIYIAKYKDKLLELHLDYFGRNSIRVMDVYTADAYYEVDILANSIKKNGTIIEQYKEDANEKYIQEMKHFLEIVAGKESDNDIVHALKIMRVALKDKENNTDK